MAKVPRIWWVAGILIAVLAVLALTLGGWPRWAAVMALAWWLPGALLTALWRLPDCDLPTAGALAAGLGLCWMVLGSLVVHWLPGPIDLPLMVGVYAAAALLLWLLLLLRPPLRLRSSPPSVWGWAIGLLLLAGLLRLPGLGYHEFHTDEVFLLRRVVWAIEGQDDALARHTKGPGQIAVTIPGYRALGTACAISLVFNLMNIGVNYTIARAFGVDLPLGVFVTFAPILSVSLLLPSVGGLGVREEAHRLLYGTVNVTSTLAVAISLTTFALQTLLPGAVGAVLYTLEGAAALRHAPGDGDPPDHRGSAGDDGGSSGDVAQSHQEQGERAQL